MPINEPVPSEERNFGSYLYPGNCLDLMSELDDNIIDACITDPPYGIRHLGNAWDNGLPPIEIWKEVYRVLAPGAHLVAAAAAKRYHHLATQLEQVGFEIRDMVVWHYSQSAPGSSQGVEGEWRSEAKRNHEPWVVARKPMDGNLGENWQKWGLGGVLVGEAGKPGWNTNVAIVPKPDKKERDLGLGGFQMKITAGAASKHKRKGGAYNAGLNLNDHPTVKPLKLVRRLVRMYTPTGGLVFDPFMGSGTTGMAAVADGYGFFGAEMDPSHFEKADARINHAYDHPDDIPFAE